MNINFGKHAGQSTEQLVLRFPDYVMWLFDGEKTGSALSAGHHIRRNLLPILDRKPFVEKCFGCSQRAKYASAYNNSPSLMFWCDKCDPYSQGASRGKLTKIHFYSDMLQFAEMWAFTKPYLRHMVRQFTQAKGAPKKITVASAAKFFSEE